MTDAGRPHRPLPLANLVELMGADESQLPFARSELAAATAAAVVAHGRSQHPQELLDLADRVGLDTLAELWRHEPPSSLAGALWALYLLRRWCQANGDEVTRLWRAGRPYAPTDEVVAGVPDHPSGADISALADAILTGAYGGDFAVALERAAAFFRVVAAGRREIAGDPELVDRETLLAARNDELATGLTRAAAAWRTDSL